MSFFVPRKVVKPSKPGTSKSHVISSSRHATVPKVNVNLNVLKDTKSTSSVDEKALARAAELALSDYALFKDGQLRQIVSESDESCTKSHYDHWSNFSINPRCQKSYHSRTCCVIQPCSSTCRPSPPYLPLQRLYEDMHLRHWKYECPWPNRPKLRGARSTYAKATRAVATKSDEWTSGLFSQVPTLFPNVTGIVVLSTW
jgi:hypothetical protein